MSESADRRRQKRVRLPESHGSLVVSLDGAVLDISLSGMAVETNTRLAPLRNLTLRLGNGERALQLNGKVVWCFLHGTRATASGEQLPVYRAGIQFGDVLTPQAQELLRFLETHAIVTLEARLFGRFRITDVDPVAVSSQAEFRVLELDSDGLTVETSVGLETDASCEVELHLDGTSISASTSVVGAHRLSGRSEETWQVRLEFREFAAADRERLNDFLRGELGGGEPA